MVRHLVQYSFAKIPTRRLSWPFFRCLTSSFPLRKYFVISIRIKYTLRECHYSDPQSLARGIQCQACKNAIHSYESRQGMANIPRLVYELPQTAVW